MGEINFLFSLIVDEAGWQNAKMFFFFFIVLIEEKGLKKSWILVVTDEIYWSICLAILLMDSKKSREFSLS